MHAEGVMFYGNRTLISSLDKIDDAHTTTSGACGWWSVKDILSHIISMEWILVDILSQMLDIDAPTPHIDELLQGSPNYNDAQVEMRADNSYQEVLAEYNDAYVQAIDLLKQVPLEKRRVAGAIAWYGDDYDLEDFIAYAIYGNKREHCGQIDVFRDHIQDRVA